MSLDPDPEMHTTAELLVEIHRLRSVMGRVAHQLGGIAGEQEGNLQLRLNELKSVLQETLYGEEPDPFQTSLIDQVDELARHRRERNAEIARLKPVVDAACRLAEWIGEDEIPATELDQLAEAVTALRGQEAT